MLITLVGIALVIIERGTDAKQENGKRSGMKFSYPLIGVLFAFGGAVGQSLGLVLSKYGMEGYDAFAATQIRLIAGLFGFVFLFFLLRRWRKLATDMKNKKAMGSLSIGAFFGPFLGVSFSLIAVQHTNTGIASTIMATVPVLIIPVAILLQKERVTLREIFGAIVSVIGVALFFIK